MVSERLAEIENDGNVKSIRIRSIHGNRSRTKHDQKREGRNWRLREALRRKRGAGKPRSYYIKIEKREV